MTQPQPQPQPQPVSSVAPESSGPSPPQLPVNLLQPSQKKRSSSRATKVFKAVTSAFRSFPIITPACRIPVGFSGFGHPRDGHIHGAVRMTGTLFGYRKARISISIQDNPRSLPILVLELAIATGRLLQEMGSGLVRLALECEKKAADKTKLLEEPVWTMYCNGRKMGYGTKRDPSEADLNVMQLLHAVSMGAGVLPSDPSTESDGELTYMRAHFDRVVGSKDSETFYMLNPLLEQLASLLLIQHYQKRDMLLGLFLIPECSKNIIRSHWRPTVMICLVSSHGKHHRTAYDIS